MDVIRVFLTLVLRSFSEGFHTVTQHSAIAEAILIVVVILKNVFKVLPIREFSLTEDSIGGWES